MTKQEEIREGMLVEIKYIMKADGNKTKIAEAECCTDTILKWQASKGVVIKVKDIQPINSYEDLTRSISDSGKYDVVAVEPLIGGKK